MYKIILPLFLFSTSTLCAKTDSHLSLNLNNYEIVKFEKTIQDISISDSSKMEVAFINNDKNPFKEIKILAKSLGSGSILVTFSDNEIENISINVVKNFQNILDTIKQSNPNLEILQSEDTVILKGEIESATQKEKIIDVLAKAGVDTEKKLIDFTTVKELKKLIKLKLYIVSINNSKGETIKNNWAVGYKNTTQNTTLFDDPMKTTMANAVSLTGGLTSMANYTGNGFNTGLVLNYLSSAGVAKVIDETTLLTSENKHAKFHSGGEILIQKTSVTNDTTSSEYIPREYGIVLDVLASKIVNDEYIDLSIATTSSKLDWGSVTVNNDVKSNLPGFSTQSIETNVMIKNNNTVILGGLINNQGIKNDWKIPFLGDIPLLGWFFRSKDYQEGKNELVFFITPEIVNTSSLDQKNLLEEKQKILLPFDASKDNNDKQETKNMNTTTEGEIN